MAARALRTRKGMSSSSRFADQNEEELSEDQNAGASAYRVQPGST
jgi:hypothetical protein